MHLEIRSLSEKEKGGQLGTRRKQASWDKEKTGT
jgi:hypothetical protein